MKIMDLTHTISGDMPVYPGTEKPILKVGCSIDADGFAEKEITFYSHIGTHIDAPAHLLKGSKTLDQLPIDKYFGEALLLDCEIIKKDNIELEDLLLYEENIKKADFLILKTGWDCYWGDEQYFLNFPVLSEDAAKWLVKQNLKGIGIDAISIDSVDSPDLPVHQIILKSNMIIIENLTKLNEIPKTKFNFSCFPLKIEDADGSPVRAVAYID